MFPMLAPKPEMQAAIETAIAQDSLFGRAIAKFEAIGKLDPKLTTLDGQSLPHALAESRLRLRFVLMLSPNPSKPLLLACFCQHLGRYNYPRSEFPDGRDGYRAWRVEAARRSSVEASRILTSLGYPTETVLAVEAIVNKRRRAVTPDVQTMEDALCLCFLHLDAPAFAEKHAEAEVLRILQRTWLKMSEPGHALALAQPFAPSLRALIEKALTPSS